MAEKYIWTQDLLAKLVIPGKEKPITAAALYLQLSKLGIKTVIRGKEGERRRAYVTSKEADLIIEDFKRIHWKKFKQT